MAYNLSDDIFSGITMSSECSYKDKPRSANSWAWRILPDVAQQFLIAFIEAQRTDQNDLTRTIVRDINDNFWACALGNLGNPLMPVVYLSSEQQFYRYNLDTGIFDRIDEDGLMALLSMFLDKCVDEVGGLVYFEDLVRLKHSRRLRKVVTRAKTLLAVGDDYFPSGWDSHIPFNNGILDVVKMKLLPFSPTFHFKSRLTVRFDSKAGSDTFQAVLRRVLSNDDLSLLQLYLGGLLAGKNYSQRILVMTGAAGWGKGLIGRLMQHILGQEHIAVIREQLFTNKNELSRYAGKKLLIHSDMPVNFLKRPEAALLKQLVGGDTLCADVDNHGATVTMEGSFGVLFCCNGRLMLPISADREAWRRRLAVIDFHEPEDDKRFGKLSEILEAKETSGILNWLLEGRKIAAQAQYQIPLTTEQQERIERILAESEPHQLFVESKIVPAEGGQLILKDAFDSFVGFCQEKGLDPGFKKDFSKSIGESIQNLNGAHFRHDLVDDSCREQRGWSGVTNALI